MAFQIGSIYFELDSTEDVYRLFFTADLPDGKYTLKAAYSVDGNSPEVRINNNSFGKTNSVESVGGKLSFVIAVGGQGKVWGNVFKMTAAKVSDSKPLSGKTVLKVKSTAAGSPAAKNSRKDRNHRRQ